MGWDNFEYSETRHGVIPAVMVGLTSSKNVLAESWWSVDYLTVKACSFLPC